MFTNLLTLSVLFVSVSCLSIGTVSEQNVTKREANAADLFPDWVPFKNKHGDELGEFVQVGKKNKVKKRLAPPINFVMRAVAEPESDYYDKGAGESDAEEYYEKREWSDINRPAVDKVDKKPIAINHTDISDIDGVVDILTQRPTSPILEAINNARNTKSKGNKKYPPVSEDEEEGDVEYDSSETSTTPEPQKKTTAKVKSQESVEGQPQERTEEISVTRAPAKEEQKSKSNEEDDEEEENKGGEEYDENTSKKPNKSEEDKANEEKKAKILSSVDELKERHAEEQRELSERIKGQDLYNDEFGRDVSPKPTPRRFHEESSEETSQRERLRRVKNRKPVVKPDYDEYDDISDSVKDKYKINVLKPESTTGPTESNRRTKTTKDGRKKGKRIESGKLSVFKNPQLYMIYDDSEETTTQPITPTHTRGPQKFSSRYTTTPSSDTDDRISFIPVESNEGEPTLFFPKPRKSRRRKVKTTTVPPTDSFVAETVTDNYKQTTALDVKGTESTLDSTAPDGKMSDVTGRGTAGAGATASDNTGPDTTGTDAVSTNTDAVTDVIPASSDHKKEKSQDYHNEKGGSREHHSEHSEEHEEHGKKAYEGHHEDKKTAKGHHDKEDHLGKYDDHGGVNKHHSEESGHYGDHHHEEHGKKHAEYEESGKHSKGHSTKGSHDVHKKEEYEKKVEFFEEEGDSADEEKHGGYNHEKEHSEGGSFKNGNLKAGHEHHSKGESGHFDKGGHHLVNKGHKQASGHDSHGKHGHKQFHKAAQDGGKKWVYHHGHPAKTANLVVIDRRGDQYYHGPHYYG